MAPRLAALRCAHGGPTPWAVASATWLRRLGALRCAHGGPTPWAASSVPLVPLGGQEGWALVVSKGLMGEWAAGWREPAAVDSGGKR